MRISPLFAHLNLTFNSDPNSKVDLVKTAARTQLDNKIEALNLYRGHISVRQLIDIVENPRSQALNYMNKIL